MRVLVVGAGVAGLASALWLEDNGVSVDIVEKSCRIGGNAVTRQIDVGGETRWIDLGVNDFNANTYHLLVALLDRLAVPHLPLDDSISFRSQTRRTCFTQDGRWGTAMPPDLAAEVARFDHQSRIDHETLPEVGDMTVRQYVAFRKFSAEFTRLALYPRISAMFFTNEVEPGSVPFRAVMSYYELQEGSPAEGADRRYFANGSERWMNALAGAVRGKVHLNTSAQIYAEEAGVTAFFSDGRHETYDAVVMCCHPDQILTSVASGLSADIAKNLGMYKYSNALAVAHSSTTVLPANANAWRTFNVTIRDSGPGLHPYSMTYIENLHQNDAANPVYASRSANANVFITLNPLESIPEEYVYRSDAGDFATHTFRHVVVDFATLTAQNALRESQGHNRIYFAGGWMQDVGLHESCLRSADEAVMRLLEDQHAPRGQRVQAMAISEA